MATAAKANKPLRFLVLLAAMYSLQSTLGALTFQGMPAVLRQAGVAPDTIGLIFVLMLPWVVKFLWAAPFERWRASHLPATRKVFLWGNALAILALLLLTQVNPAQQLVWVFAALTLVALVSSTVDVAIDGYAMGQPDHGRRSWVNVMQIGGGYTGTIIGGGLFLILIGEISWQLALVGMALVLCLLLIPALTDQQLKNQPNPAKAASLRQALANPAVQRGLFIVILVQFGLRLVQGMMMPFMVDKGISLTSLGLAATLGSSLLSLAAVFITGLLVKRWGGWPVLLSLLAIQVVLYSLFYLFSAMDTLPLAVAVTLLLSCSAIMAASFVALYTLMMGWSASNQVGVDFTLLQCMDSAVALVAGVLSGIIVQQLGYSLYFAIACVIAFSAFIFLIWLNFGRTQLRTE